MQWRHLTVTAAGIVIVGLGLGCKTDKTMMDRSPGTHTGTSGTSGDRGTGIGTGQPSGTTGDPTGTTPAHGGSGTGTTPRSDAGTTDTGDQAVPAGERGGNLVGGTAAKDNSSLKDSAETKDNTPPAPRP